MLNKDISLVADAVAKVLAGDELSEETLYALADIDSDEGRAAIIDGAAKITERFCSRKFDFCSIINARSGRCPENCNGAPSRHTTTQGARYTSRYRTKTLSHSPRPTQTTE